jgi:cobalt/nickel transport system permease protein
LFDLEMKRAFAFGLLIAATSIGSVANGQAAPAETKPEAAPPATKTETAAPAAKPEAAPATTKTESAAPAAKPEAMPAPTKPAGPEPARPGATVRTVGYVVECLGLASIIAGAVVKAMSSAKHDVIDQHCDSHRVCDQAGMDAVSSASRLQTAAFASLIGGMVAVGTGVVLVVSSPAGNGASASVQPTVLHGGAGLSLGGRF